MLPQLGTKQRFVITAFALLGAALLILVITQFIIVGRAHSSFENYYAFRGCQTLLTKTNDDATCRLPSGKVIKIVRYHGKWYLDDDLPVCWLGKSLCW